MKKREILRAGVVLAVMIAPLFQAKPAQASGAYCREYTKTIWVGGQREKGYGRACLQPDGAWEIVDLEGSDTAQEFVRDDIRDRLYSENRRVVIVDRYGPVYDPPVYQISRYRPATFALSFGHGGHAKRKRGWEHCEERHERGGRGYGHIFGHGRGHHDRDD